MYEKYQWLSLYILMIEKWDSTNKSKNKFKKMIIKNDIQWINRKIIMHDCKWIMRYFAEIFVLKHTDQTRTKINLS